MGIVLTSYGLHPIVLLNETTEENMSNTTNDVLPTSVPKLDMSETNWAIFVLLLQTVVQVWGHFDSSMPCLVLSLPVQSSSILISTPLGTTTLVITVRIGAQVMNKGS